MISSSGTDSLREQSPNSQLQCSGQSEDQRSDRQNKVNKKDSKLIATHNLMISILKGERTIDSVEVKDLPDLIQALKEERDNKLSHRNTEESEKTNVILFSARQYYNKKKKENATEVRIAKIDNRIAKAKENLSKVKHDNLIKSEKLDELHKKQIHELGEKQIHETEQLRTSWNSLKYQRMFNKPSTELRTLQLQASLLQKDRSRQLEQIKTQKQVFTLSQTEKNEKSRLMNSQYNEAIRNLERKQKSDLNTLLQKQKVQKDEQHLKETQEISMCEMQLANLLKEKEKLNRFAQANQNNGNQNNRQENQAKPCYAQFTKLTLPSLPSTSPRRMKMRTMRYKNS